jgi:flagellar protein FlgJ
MLSLDRSDLLLDVLRAADPARAEAAMKRLGAISGSNSFSIALAQAKAAEWTPSPPDQGVGAPSAMHPPHKIAVSQTAGQSFEAAILRPFLDSIFSSSPANAFGSGFAGSSFRGFFLDHVSAQLSRSGSIGIARLIDDRLPFQEPASSHHSLTGGIDAVKS